MKYLILIVVAVLSLTSAVEMDFKDNPDLMKCAKEVGLDINDKSMELKKEFKCLFKCALETDGLLKDGTFVDEKIIRSLQSDAQLDRNGKEAAIKNVPKCVEQAKKQSDLCEKSYEFFVCIYNR